jgi:hypothetical protein
MQRGDWLIISIRYSFVNYNSTYDRTCPKASWKTP